MKDSPEKILRRWRHGDTTLLGEINASMPLLVHAIEQADSTARADIESECHCSGNSGLKAGWWWDTTPTATDDEGHERITNQVLYLEERGLLVRLEGAPHIVTFIEAA